MKKWIWILVLVLVVGLLTTALVLFDSTYTLLNWQVVRRDAVEVILTGDELPAEFMLKKLHGPQVLDVRQIPVTPEQYQGLRTLFPNTQIRYKIVLGAQGVDMNATELTLAVADVAKLPGVLPCLPQLTGVKVEGAGADWSLLTDLMTQYPAISFDFEVDVCGAAVRSTETVLDLGAVQVDTAELAQKLACFPKLQRLLVPGCEDYAWLLAQQEARPELDIFYTLTVAGVETDNHATELTVENVTIPMLEEALPHLKGLQKLHLEGTLPEDEELYKLAYRYPDVAFCWDITVCGVAANTGDTTLILNNIPMANTDEVRQKVRYFYNLERVEMCYCGIPSVEMENLTIEFPDTRFVWAVRIGKGYLRTDATAFIPYHLGYNVKEPFGDEECRELKYCIDIECMDLGHMRMYDISFLNYMPKMKFLVLGDTWVRDFSPLKGLTELVYLEIFNTRFSDHSLLLNMTKLEDLNIGFTPAPGTEVLKQMTWLKRLWMPAVGFTRAQFDEVVEALPNTQVEMYIAHSTAGNWRDNDNYREMRDRLGMFYME